MRTFLLFSSVFFMQLGWAAMPSNAPPLATLIHEIQVSLPTQTEQTDAKAHSTQQNDDCIECSEVD
ncbi:hypothetical protein CBF23_006970 [Marinomonas agarivorans]|nr:hypothetical protein CBF23_006970 [Marinomonas agarivorans]